MIEIIKKMKDQNLCNTFLIELILIFLLFIIIILANPMNTFEKIINLFHFESKYYLNMKNKNN